MAPMTSACVNAHVAPAISPRTAVASSSEVRREVTTEDADAPVPVADTDSEVERTSPRTVGGQFQLQIWIDYLLVSFRGLLVLDRG